MSRHVVLVCGPPCAGKTTYVQEHAEPDDLILDADDIARAAGSPAKWKHSQQYRDIAEQAMLNGIDQVASSTDTRAWIIRSLPSAQDRARLAAHIRADQVIVLTPDLDVLLARAKRRAPGTRGTILRWLARANA
jgi:5-methylcytosine-specific restriction protein A